MKEIKLLILIFVSLTAVGQRTNDNESINLNIPSIVLDYNKSSDYQSISSSGYQVKSIVENLTFKNNIKQILDSTISQLWDTISKTWINSNEVVWEYDSNLFLSKFERRLWNIDSSKFICYLKENHIYDKNENLIDYIEYRLDKISSKLELKNKTEQTFNEDNKITQTTTFDWDIKSEVWTPKIRREYNYTDKGNKDEIIDYLWETSSSSWSVISKEKYNYNLDGDNYLILKSVWNASKNEWMLYDKIEFVYFKDGRLSNYVKYKMNENINDWENIAKVEYSYSENEKLINEQSFDWNKSNNAWINNEKYEYDYDSFGNTILYINNRWDSINNDWKKIRKEVYKYSADNLLKEYIWFKSNSDGDEFLEYKRNTYMYDSHQNIIQVIGDEWDVTISQWQIVAKAEYEYDNDYSFDELKLPESMSIVSDRHKRINRVTYIWDTSLSEWNNYSREFLYYSDTDYMFVNDLANSDFKIFPNPFSDFLSFQLPESCENASLVLYDSQSKQLINQSVINNKTLYINNLQKGIYIYHLYIDGRKLKGKLLKR